VLYSVATREPHLVLKALTRRADLHITRQYRVGRGKRCSEQGVAQKREGDDWTIVSGFATARRRHVSPLVANASGRSSFSPALIRAMMTTNSVSRSVSTR
jgi:hypothetical protein